MASLPAMVALAKIDQLPTTMHSERFDLTRFIGARRRHPVIRE